MKDYEKILIEKTKENKIIWKDVSSEYYYVCFETRFKRMTLQVDCYKDLYYCRFFDSNVFLKKSPELFKAIKKQIEMRVKKIKDEEKRKEEKYKMKIINSLERK